MNPTSAPKLLTRASMSASGLPLTTTGAVVKQGQLEFVLDLMEVIDRHRVSVLDPLFTKELKARALQQNVQELAKTELHLSGCSDEDLLTSLFKLAINYGQQRQQSSPHQKPPPRAAGQHPPSHQAAANRPNAADREDAEDGPRAWTDGVAQMEEHLLEYKCDQFSYLKKEKIFLPTWKFTAKAYTKTLEHITPTVRYGLKVVRILHQSDTNDKTLRCIDFPGKGEQLYEGDVCWVVPLLDDDVEIFDPGNCQEKIDEAFQKLYTALEDAKPEACRLSRQTKAGKLANFRKDYCKDGKLVQDNLPLHWATYDGILPAAVCTDKEADKLLMHVNGLNKETAPVGKLQEELESGLQTAERTEFLPYFQDPAAGGGGEELTLLLRFMNMRNKYNISPVGVIHGGSGLTGIWEIPERWTTVVFKGDRIVFLEPDDRGLRDAFESKVNLLMHADLPTVKKRIRLSKPVSGQAGLPELLDALKNCKDPLLKEIPTLMPAATHRGGKNKKKSQEKTRCQ
eukprot:s217_g21.t2